MVSLQFFQPEDFPELNYKLDETQSQFTAKAEEALQRISERQDDLAYPVTVFYGEKAAGFFVLDFGDDKLDLTDNPDSVLVRSLSINPDLQGKGIGKSAMLKMDDFIKENFKDCNEIVLAVNQNNTSAYELYLKTGYFYDGKTRIGRSGPQYLMYKKL
ncbi:GNAT family N-acetyltransferase [Chryseobacterium daecheongense]|uniref:GNAT family N-acetyltransferase n=1 Tax=Chryseobacterium daecheongense TaxID=192389 RepID=A0A3N0VXH0_9FLAO|nr:GNAT family N-acetyltransferase [Chryseobacterium daecheongense]ROH97502.1 GNAT family N-acetyltransferase [Chryseobacterium daecheongense]TDX93349.1 RimJ/RimL family protein N-acetyltransferase [Chryseobacterium daecheongense]UOU98640.1 GNAT family N-acetyltransferase [Chryseobacterium daecheongense]